MKRPRIVIPILLLISLLISPARQANAQSDSPVVHAVLFYSPTCPHCHLVINETILPMLEKYGEQLKVIGIDVTQQQGQAYFQSAMQKFSLESSGVPFLVIDNMYLVGSADIPDKFPSLVESYLAQGGVDWPEIPGLTETLKSPQNIPEATVTPTPAPVAHAVLFQRSTCSHCQKIIEEVIPPLLKKYGNQLKIFSVDVSVPDGEAIYQAAIEKFHIEKFGVPTLIMGDQVLVGGTEIEEKIEGITAEYLSKGGVDWPNIIGLPEAISKALDENALTAAAPYQSETLQTPPTPDSTPQSSASPTKTPGIIGLQTETSNWLDTFARDPIGNSLSVFILMGMLASIVWVITLFKKKNGVPPKIKSTWIIPILCVIGMGVAGYLAYVEATQVEAVCGPVGDCNTVQQSEYAHLFGILPIGVLGLFGYIAILLSWLAAQYGRERLADYAVIFIFIMTASGTLFSIYLTFLEPFVIGATCAWCLTSAVLMTLLMLFSVRSAKLAINRTLFSTSRSH